MRFILFILLFATSTVVLGQNKDPKTTVFKVRAPLSAVSVFMEDSTFWLEKENKVRVKVRSKCENIKVVFSSGKIIAQEGDDYTLTFEDPGATVLSVYEINGKKRKMIFTQKYRIREPHMYFCGVKVGTISHQFKMKGDHLRAYSIPYDMSLKVIGYDMVYNDGVSTTTFHADNNMLTQKMYDLLFEDSRSVAKSKREKKIYFSNILTNMPDGGTKTLSPFMVYVVRDTSNKDEIIMNFDLRRVVFKK